MRRILAVAALVLAGLLAAPATGQAAAPDPLGGGAVLFNPIGFNIRCTASFAAVDARGTGYLVTEASCTDLADQVYSVDSTGSATLVGRVVSRDVSHAVVQVTNTLAWDLVPWIETGSGKVVIAGSRETDVGGPVCLIDRPTAFKCGKVIVKNDPTGPAKGLTRTDICASDNSVAYVTRDQAQGVPAGGSSFCTNAGTSWFAPINPILRAEGLSLLTG